MTKKTAKIKRRILKNILGVFSFTTALFIFQACYGVPQDYYEEGFVIEGSVKSAETGNPIEGIQITANDGPMTYTNSSGTFTLYMMKIRTLKLSIEDVDRRNNGIFFPQDTTILNSFDTYQVHVDILLNEK